MTIWSLPVIDTKPRNNCGECTECCTVLPIYDGDFLKPAGEPCKYLCDKGCSIWKKENFPDLCRNYFCEWRRNQWLGCQPRLRPDKLGVVIQDHGHILAVFECRPGAAYSPETSAVVRRFQRNFRHETRKLRVNVYKFGGVTWGMVPVVRNGKMVAMSDSEWSYRREPYEHFFPQGSSGGKEMARDLIEFFRVNPARQEVRISIDTDGLGMDEFDVPRSRLADLQEIAEGKKAVEGEWEWLKRVHPAP